MKAFVLVFATLVLSQSVFAAPPTVRECRAEAMGAAYNELRPYIEASDFHPIVRVFSSRDQGRSVTHYVQIIIDGQSSMTTVEMTKQGCELLRLE